MNFIDQNSSILYAWNYVTYMSDGYFPHIMEIKPTNLRMPELSMDMFIITLLCISDWIALAQFNT